MSKEKNIKKDKLPTHNPADEGVDHNVTQGHKKDYEESYIEKQEGAGGRGIDNEDSTDEGAEDNE